MTRSVRHTYAAAETPHEGTSTRTYGVKVPLMRRRTTVRVPRSR